MLKLPATLFLMLGLLVSTSSFADDDDTPKPQKQATQTSGNHDVVTLDPEQQLRAGLQTIALSQSKLGPESIAFGSVVNLERLLVAREQFLHSLAQQQTAYAKNAEAQLNLSRTQSLHNQDIVSSRRLQEQQAQAQTEQAQLAISHYQKELLLNNCQLEWGADLCQWLTDAKGRHIQEFLAQKAQLLQITLPAGHELISNQQQIFVDEHGKRENAIPAHLISVIPLVDNVTQGRRYFFKSKLRPIAYGSHLTAWLSESSPNSDAVDLPRSAVVRHNGEAMVFIKTKPNEFSRQVLHHLTPNQACCFNTSELQAGQEIVITGAQTLLSQSLKAQIPEEDDD